MDLSTSCPRKFQPWTSCPVAQMHLNIFDISAAFDKHGSMGVPQTVIIKGKL